MAKPCCRAFFATTLTFLALGAIAASNDAAPLPGTLAYKPLPTGSATPKGWLLEQLKLQADGLSGHLSQVKPFEFNFVLVTANARHELWPFSLCCAAQFWPDIMSSIWIGGHADTGLHERVPYWLNGVVPLAFLLRNAGAEALSSRAHPSHAAPQAL